MGDLVTGAKCTVTHIHDADLFQGIFGSGRYVLATGNACAASIVDNNTVRIADGVIVSQGRRIQIKANTADDFVIETGTQNATRYDIIGYHIYSDGGQEYAEKFVRKNVGESGVVAEESLRDGADDTYISMYKVKLEGLTITELIPLYDMALTGLHKMQQEIKVDVLPVEISPYAGSSYYDMEIIENESYYYPGLGIAVINVHAKQTYKKASSVNHEDLVRFGTANIQPAIGKAPITVYLDGNYTRRYSGNIAEDGFITARTNTSYNPNKGSVYNYYISAVYTIRKEG